MGKCKCLQMMHAGLFTCWEFPWGCSYFWWQGVEVRESADDNHLCLAREAHCVFLWMPFSSCPVPEWIKVYENDGQIVATHQHTSPFPRPGGHLFSKAKKGLAVYLTLGIKLAFKCLPLTGSHICSVTNFTPPPSPGGPRPDHTREIQGWDLHGHIEHTGKGLPPDWNDKRPG